MEPYCIFCNRMSIVCSVFVLHMFTIYVLFCLTTNPHFQDERSIINILLNYNQSSDDAGQQPKSSNVFSLAPPPKIVSATVSSSEMWNDVSQSRNVDFNLDEIPNQIEWILCRNLKDGLFAYHAIIRAFHPVISRLLLNSFHPGNSEHLRCSIAY